MRFNQVFNAFHHTFSGVAQHNIQTYVVARYLYIFSRFIADKIFARIRVNQSF